MNLSYLLLLMISPPMSASKVAYGLGRAKVNGEQEPPLRKRVLQDANCGQVKEGYTPTDVQSINSDMAGQKVMVTSTVTPSQLAACTQMFCEDDPCCNSCSSQLLFGEIELVAKEGVDPLGCSGNNCNWQEKCTYNKGELVTVYAEVAINEGGNVYLAVDEHCTVGSITTQDVSIGVLPETGGQSPTCTDVADKSFGLCYMHMGYGIVDGTCQPIGGCGTEEYVFFSTIEDCQANCAETPTVASTTQTMAEPPCGEEREGYTKMSVSSIGPDMDGQKVMVTSAINNSDDAACTVMACSEDDQCCNSCSSLPRFGEISLVPNGSENTIGCAGTNCDWQDNCVYQNDDVVTVYGEVASGGTVLKVDDNCIAASTCEDLSGKSFGNCKMLLGFGVVDGTCQSIGGCDAEGYIFFDSMEACMEDCFPANVKAASSSAENHGSFQIMKLSQMLFVFAFLFY